MPRQLRFHPTRAAVALAALLVLAADPGFAAEKLVVARS
jgi:hypothetical protein